MERFVRGFLDLVTLWFLNRFGKHPMHFFGLIGTDSVKPTANWIDFVITSRARSKIKSSLNEEKKRIASEGKESLRRKLKHLKVTK